MTVKTHYRTCPLCEAICGLEITTDGRQVRAIKGDRDDPFSRGYVCPKAVALQDLHTDPDRLRKPMIRAGEKWRETDWHSAFCLVCERLLEVEAQHGPDAVAIYQGNPSVHNIGMMTHSSLFLRHFKTRNRYSATSVDQLPHQLVSYLLYGHQLLAPVPDIDRTMHLVLIGSNPLASNGSLMTVPDVKKRLGAVMERGGQVVIIDPRRTETASFASAHQFIRPDSDAAFLLSFLHTLFEEDLIRLGGLEGVVEGLEDVRAAVQAFTPERAAEATGIAAPMIRQMVRDFAAAKCAALHGRMGISTQSYGALCQWLIHLIMIVTGNLDRPGGALFTKPAVDLIANSNPGSYDTWRSRVRGLPEFNRQTPVAALSEEILTPGDGQVRALITAAGNPVLSTPNGRQLDKALKGLEFMVSVDSYLNETTRHADVILPPASPLERDHFDLIFNIFAVRNTVKYSPALFPKEVGTLDDWEIFAGLADVMANFKDRPAPEPFTPADVVNMGLQNGPYDLTLEGLKEWPHGLDLGPLEPCLPERLMTPDKKINCAVPVLLADIERAACDFFTGKDSRASLRLIGKRDLRSNNSWMHNSLRLVKGPERCVLFMHPDDLAQRQLKDGDYVKVTSRVGSLMVDAAASADVMPGTVCLPHGWGHSRPGIRMRIAGEHAGVSLNDLTDDSRVDPVSGNAAFNGTPVEVTRAD